jgi:hypothetical protein
MRVHWQVIRRPPAARSTTLQRIWVCFLPERGAVPARSERGAVVRSYERRMVHMRQCTTGDGLCLAPSRETTPRHLVAWRWTCRIVIRLIRQIAALAPLGQPMSGPVFRPALALRKRHTKGAICHRDAFLGFAGCTGCAPA